MLASGPVQGWYQAVNYINLTNGLQAIDDYQLTGYSFMRLQSTHCEQKRWADVLASVPDDMLMRLALGQDVTVYDYGARKAVPRAVWQGLEFVKFVLTWEWLGREYVPVGRVASSSGYFWQALRELPPGCLSRLRSFERLAGGVHRDFQVTLHAVTGPSKLEGRPELIREAVVGL